MHGVGAQQRVERSTARRRNFDLQFAAPTACTLTASRAQPAESDFSRLYTELSGSHAHSLNAEFQRNHAALQRLTSGFAALQTAVLEREAGVDADTDRAQQWRSYRTPERISGSDTAGREQARICEAGTQTFEPQARYQAPKTRQIQRCGAICVDLLQRRQRATGLAACERTAAEEPAAPPHEEHLASNEAASEDSGTVSVEDEYEYVPASAETDAKAPRQNSCAQNATYKTTRQQHSTLFYQRLEAFLGRQTAQSSDEKTPAERPARAHLNGEFEALSDAYENRAAAGQPCGRIRIEELTVVGADAYNGAKAHGETSAPAPDLACPSESSMLASSSRPSDLHRSAAAPLHSCESVRADEIARQRLSSAASLRGMRHDIEELMRAFTGDVARSVLGDGQDSARAERYLAEQGKEPADQWYEEQPSYLCSDGRQAPKSTLSAGQDEPLAAAEPNSAAVEQGHVSSSGRSAQRESDMEEAALQAGSPINGSAAAYQWPGAEAMPRIAAEDAESRQLECSPPALASEQLRLQIVPMQAQTEVDFLQRAVLQGYYELLESGKEPGEQTERKAAAWPLAVSQLHEPVEEQAELPAISPLLPQKYVVDAAAQQTSLAASPVAEPHKPQNDSPFGLKEDLAEVRGDAETEQRYATDGARPALYITEFDNKTPESEFPVHCGDGTKFDSFGFQPPASLNVNSSAGDDVYSQLLTSPKSCVLSSSPVEYANQQFAAEFLRMLVQVGLVQQDSVFPHKSYSREQIVRLRKLKGDFAVAEKQARKKQYGDKFEQFYRAKLQQIAAEAVCLLAEQPSSRRSSTASQRAKLLM